MDTTLPVGRMCLGVALVATTWGTLIAGLRYAGMDPPTFALPVVRLDVGASLLASVTAVACFFRWRLEGTASAFWAGLAVFVVGCSGFLSTAVTRGYVATGIACSVVTVGLVGAWLRGSEVDAALSVPKVVVRTVAALVVAFAGARFAVMHGLARAPLSIAIGVALVGVAIAVHRARTRDEWMVVVLSAYGASALLYAAMPVLDPLRSAAASSLHLFAMGMAAFSSTLLLHEAAARQRETAFRLRVERDEAKDRFAETLHEVRSTVTALEGGVRTFEPAHDDPAQAVLSRALVAEIQRLRALVDDRPAHPEVETFWISDVLDPMLTVCVAAGRVISWDIPADLHAVGRAADVAQVVHALLMNAQRHAPDSPVDVVVCREAAFALIRVDDRGPGVAPEQAETIFERGERGDAAVDLEGRGLGLHIARTIARAQGGDLWVQPRRGGGASFVMTVPTVTVLPTAIGDRERAGATVRSHALRDTRDHSGLRNAQ